MQALLDTHTFLWAASNKPLLSAAVLAILEDSNNEIFLSIVTPWEISIKVCLKKLTLPASPEKFVNAQIKDLYIIVIPLTDCLLPSVLRKTCRFFPLMRLLIPMGLCGSGNFFFFAFLDEGGSVR